MTRHTKARPAASGACQKTVRLSLVLLCATVLCLACGVLPATAAVQHVFLPGPSGAIGGGASEGAVVPGPLSGVRALTVDSGHVWVADKLESAGPNQGKSRVDEFDAAGGGFLAQLVGEAGVTNLEGSLAVGHPGVEEVEYVLAGHEGTPVVAVYAGTHLAKVWTGAGSANGSFTQSAGAHVGSLAGVAVDGSNNPATEGDVYVATYSVAGESESFNVVDVYKSEVGGGEPAGTVAELRGTCVVAGTCPGKVIPFGEPRGVAVSGFNGDVLVTDTSIGAPPVVDVFAPLGGGEYAFVRQLTGSPAGAFSGEGAVAVDGGNGEIYVSEPSAKVVDEFSVEGVFLGRLEGTGERAFDEVRGVGVDGSTHRVYVGEYDEASRAGAVDVFGPDVVVPDVETFASTAVKVEASGGIGVTLNGTVDLVGEGEASCRFEYGTSEAFGSSVPCSASVTHEPGPDPVSARLSGLPPDTKFFYRLVASNGNGTNHGEARQDRSFTTPGPGLVGEGVAGVSASSATFVARIDPHGGATSFYFQYSTIVSTGECDVQPVACVSVPLAPGEAIGSAQEVLAEQAHAQGLQPDTLYHYRLVALNRVEPDPEGKPKVFETVAFAAADRTFTTQSAGTGFVLPDGRAWELVSPPDKHGALIFSLGAAPGVLQAAVSGAAVSYPVTSPTGTGAHGDSEAVQVLSTRISAGGWSSTDIALPHAGAVGAGIGAGLEYRAFSQDLSLGLVEPFGPFTSLNTESFPADSERTPYVRHDQTCQTEPTGCYQPLLTGAPGYANVPEGTKFGGPDKELRGEVQYVGATGDLSHIILASHVTLTKTSTNGVGELYEWSAGKPPAEQLQLVSILPNEQPASEDLFLGAAVNVRSAISTDGTHVVWTASVGGVFHLYEFVGAFGRSVQLDLPQGGDGGGQVVPVFQGASSDGKRVFFTDAQRLTASATAASGTRPSLYECEINETGSEPTCDLRDLTVPGGKEDADVQGTILATSQDGTSVYFVANGVLAQGATPGDCATTETSPPDVTCSLYELHYDGSEWETKLVTTLSGADQPDWTGYAPGDLSYLTSRLSPDGEWLAFMSSRELTGYDNHDAITGQPDEEVYLYNTTTGKLACASCNPTGAQPKGVEYAQVKDGLVGGGDSKVWTGTQGLAASIPGWTPYEAHHANYQPRYLSNTGRLFFDSADALVPQDINNNQDVYQYEPAGTGACTTTTSATFNPASGGCVSLISSGASSGESAFVDAGETGDDTFFLTSEKLLPSDLDSGLDLYDAHTCTTAQPCPNIPTPPPACTTADACRTAPTPQPAIFGSPASATFTGAGNPTPTTPPTLKPKSLTRAQKLTRALAACHKHKNKHKRTTCERQAKKRYSHTAAAPNDKTAKPRG